MTYRITVYALTMLFALVPACGTTTNNTSLLPTATNTPRPTKARPDAKQPSAMLGDLDPPAPRAAEARLAATPQALPEESVPDSGNGEPPSAMRQDLDDVRTLRTLSVSSQPAPMPEEPAPEHP